MRPGRSVGVFSPGRTGWPQATALRWRPGSPEAFDDCPAYYLRTAAAGLPAIHLIEDVTHPAELVGNWAFEVESGSRQIDSLSPKAIDGVHLWFREKRAREKLEDELRKRKN